MNVGESFLKMAKWCDQFMLFVNEDINEKAA